MKKECTLKTLHIGDTEDGYYSGGYAWNEVFKYAVNPESADGLASRETFIKNEVVEVIGSINGENDGPPWEMIGRLKDGRYFYIEASCDYTGWDCRASGSAKVALTVEPLQKKPNDYYGHLLD